MPEQTEETPRPEEQPAPTPKPSEPRHFPHRHNQPRQQQAPREGSDAPAKGEVQGQEVHPQQRRPPQQQHHGQQQFMDLTVVIPLYNEEESLRELHSQLRSALNRMNARYELLFVDDGSTDRSFQVLRDLKRNDKHVKVVRFRRNYGKSAALAVGFQKALGNTVITMDADLQDDPAEIPALRRKLDEGFDLVSGWKKVRHDPISKTLPSRFFNFVTSKLTGTRLHDLNCGLKAYRKEVVKTVKIYGELHRFIPVLARWEGFRIGELVVQHRARRFGTTKFGMGRFWKGFLDLLTVLFTTRYLRRPLHLFGLWGLIAVLAGFVIVGWLVVEKLFGYISLSNRPLFLGGILLVIVGVQFISIGLLGEMISKTRHVEEEYSIREFLA